MEGREGARHPCPQIQILGKGRTGNWPGPGLGGGWMEGRPRRRPRGAREREGKEKKASSRGAMGGPETRLERKASTREAEAKVFHEKGMRKLLNKLLVSQKTAEKTAKKLILFAENC